MPPRLPLLPCHSPEDVVAWHEGAPISAEQFLNDVEYVAAGLPAQPYVLNLCENRYHFLIGFCAALVTGHASLLPPNRAPMMLAQLKDRYDGLCCLTDTTQDTGEIAATRISRAPRETSLRPMPDIPPDRVAVIVFTSGTTGSPQPHKKVWSSLVHVARSTAARFGIAARDRMLALATVPPQHMFGLEASIMLPLQNGGIVHAARPFFPEDVRAAMSECRCPHFLVTTPFHLRACLEAGLQFPSPRFVLSATAELNRSLALQAEKAFRARVLEVYGCTEAGTIGTRRTVASDAWELLTGLSLRIEDNDVAVTGKHLIELVVLRDCVELLADGRFHLIGRKSDLVNIAGKRMSLSDLNQKLLDINGVSDGTFFVPDGPDETVNRLIAMVVAPALSRQQIVAELRQRVDPVFLPRPLYLVDKLPRNATGKLTHDELRQVAALCRHTALASDA